MEEYLCLIVLAREGESSSAFSSRLSVFWTSLLRATPNEFEKVFAEGTSFGIEHGRHSRQYLIKPDVADLLERELQQAGLDFEPIDRADTYTKYDAVPSEWMQIEH